MRSAMMYVGDVRRFCWYAIRNTGYWYCAVAKYLKAILYFCFCDFDNML